MTARRSRRSDTPHIPPAAGSASARDTDPDTRADLGSVGSDSPAAIARVTTSRYAAMAVSLLVGVVLARSLDPAERGVYAVALTLTAVPSIVASAGLETAALRSVNRDQRREVFGLILRRLILVSGGSIVGIVTVLVLWRGLLGLTPLELIICLLSIPPVVAVQLYGNATLGLRRWRLWVAATLVNALTYLAVTATVAATGEAGVVPYQAAFLAGYLVALAFFVLMAIRQEHDLHIDRRALAAQTASRTRWITISQTMFMRVQVPLLQALAGTSAVGVLAVASPVGDLMLVLPVAAATVLLPRYYTTEPTWMSVRRNAIRVAALTATVGVLVVLVSPWVVPLLYGADYEGAVVVLQIIVPGVVLFSYARVLQSYLISRSRYARVLWASVLAVFASVGVQLVASPTLGAVGSALAVSGGYTVMFLLIASARTRRRVAQ